MTTTTRLELRTHLTGADPVEVEQATDRLRRELLELDVEDVRPVLSGPAPPGARGLDAAQLGALAVTLLGTPELLSCAVAAVRAWVGQGGGRAVEVTLDGDTLRLSDASPEQQQQVVDAWLSRHG